MKINKANSLVNKLATSAQNRMKKIIILFSFLNILTSFNIQNSYVDPTGTYELNNIIKQKNGEIYGYFGQIQIKKLNPEKIIMTFEVNKGAPSYNSGSFVDTLVYKENKAVYRDTEVDTTCTIIFNFNKKGINVVEKTGNYNWGCGFGHGVVADGFYKKISNKVPILTEPLTGEKLNK
ncbi:MAG: hypothetical protein RLZZ529_519 [Bacteroidota bacterium]